MLASQPAGCVDILAATLGFSHPNEARNTSAASLLFCRLVVTLCPAPPPPTFNPHHLSCLTHRPYCISAILQLCLSKVKLMSLSESTSVKSTSDFRFEWCQDRLVPWHSVTTTGCNQQFKVCIDITVLHNNNIYYSAFFTTYSIY